MIIKEAGKELNIPERELVESWFQKTDKRQLEQSLHVGREVETKLVLFNERPQPQAILQIRKLFSNFTLKAAINFGLKTEFNAGRQSVGIDWYKTFMESNSQIYLRKAEGIYVARSQGMSTEDVKR
jgi:hypothetical protein